MRPSELPRPDEVPVLTDDEAPDFLERFDVAALAFLDMDAPASAALRNRLQVVLAKMESGLGRLGVGVVDVNRHRLVAEALHVKSVPTLVVFAGGSVVDRVMGSPPEAVIEEVLRARLPRTG